MLRVRASMAMLAVWLMVCSSGVMLWLAHAGYASVAAMTWWALVATGGLVVMAALVRLDLTATWRDPALTFPQILWAVTSSAVAYVLIGEVKGVIHGLLALTLLFAALNLKAKQIVAVSLYALGTFSLAVLFSIHLSHESAPEIAYAAVLLIMLLGCMLLSLQLYQLRVRLRRQRQELVLALAENRELASRDPLTGVLNRRHMLELMHLEQRRCLRGQRTMLLAQMDIDHFKQINDTHGHGVGDLALMTFTQVVRENIRSSDVLARWGGRGVRAAAQRHPPGRRPADAGAGACGGRGRRGRGWAAGLAHDRVHGPGRAPARRGGGADAGPGRQGLVRGQARRTQPRGAGRGHAATACDAGRVRAGLHPCAGRGAGRYVSSRRSSAAHFRLFIR